MPIDQKALARFSKGATHAGETITSIVGRNAEIMVYMVEGSTVEGRRKSWPGIRWLSVDEVEFSSEQSRVLADFSRRYDSLSEVCSDRPVLAGNLALELYNALVNPPASTESAFSGTDASIDAARESASQRTRAVYGSAAATSGIVSAAVLAGIGALISGPSEFLGLEVRSLLGASAVGGIGALASVLYKLRKIEVSHYPGTKTAAFGGSSRVLLGIVFGAVLFVAASAGVAFSFLLDKAGGALLIGFIGGISERAVPELITRLESNGRDTPEETKKEEH